MLMQWIFLIMQPVLLPKLAERMVEKTDARARHPNVSSSLWHSERPLALIWENILPVRPRALQNPMETSRD